MYVVKVKMVWRRVRTAERFEAPDPWNGGQNSPFSVEVYRMFPERVQDPRDWREGTLATMGSAVRYGIRSEADGVERMLPTFLGQLYARGQVPADKLPGALHGLEGEIGNRDYRHVPGRGVLVVAAVGLAALAIGVIGLRATLGSFTGAPAASAPVMATAASWAGAPVAVGQTFLVSGLLPLDGREPAPTTLVVPEDIARAFGSAWRLAWTRAAGGHRALLIPERAYLRDGGVELGYVRVVAPEELGLAAALAALKARVPDLDATGVACAQWLTTIGGGGGTPGTAVIVFGVLALVGIIVGFGFGLAWLIRVPQSARNRKLAARVLASLGSAAGARAG
jgi:hypothetical protein